MIIAQERITSSRPRSAGQPGCTQVTESARSSLTQIASIASRSPASKAP